MKDIPKAYDASKVEDEIYQRWEASGFFNPDNLPGVKGVKSVTSNKRSLTAASPEAFTIAMPPPNVTGVLHIGHAFENALMDIPTRFQRMRGKKVLLLPGTDHAAVATQSRVEADLIESGEYQNPRQELGREKLLEIIRDYAENSKIAIIRQIKKLGTSCDWSRLAYTFDEPRSKAVNTMFKKMYDDELIYRGYRVVNWSVKGQSTASDDELIYVERKATLWTFRYAKDFPISIATTRPETKLGDTAVAVNPKDKRYKKYLGRVFTVDVGAVKPLKIKIIADEGVDMEFGTGALGVTPAHSPVDYEMYEKQKAKGDAIDLIPVIGIDGRMTEQAGKDYQGLTVEEAREKFVEYLRQQGLLKKEEEITQNVGTSDRFKDSVEALPMEQWFVDVNKRISGKGKSLKDLMREAVTSGHNNDPKQKVEITPERFQKSYLNWIDNLRDWCISRQIWWGHRIPVYYRKRGKPKSNEVYVGKKPPKGEGWEQDSDTLDTWFSSALWTFSTLGWPRTITTSRDLRGKPRKTGDLEAFHPTSWMQMGYEILFFWMARMILMSTYALDEIPFKDVYIHGMVRNVEGKKFSKSDRTGKDPLELIEQYGSDALRLSLILGVAPGNDERFYLEKIEGAKHLVNKVWNISRFIISNNKDGESGRNIEAKNCSQADLWILKKMQDLIMDVTFGLDNYNFSAAGERLRDFTWGNFADWYLEISKIEKNAQKGIILNLILRDLLKLWHPFMPFVTEALWQEMKNQGLLMVESWPDQNFYHKIIEQTDKSFWFEPIQDIVSAIRNMRSEYKIKPAQKISALIAAGSKTDLLKLLENQKEIIKRLARLQSLEISENIKKPAQSITVMAGGVEIYLLVGGIIDIEKEEVRLKGELENLEKYVKGLRGKLANKEFLAKAPAAVVEAEKQKQHEAEEKLKKLAEQLATLG